jgi:hypothetical protein
VAEKAAKEAADKAAAEKAAKEAADKAAAEKAAKVATCIKCVWRRWMSGNGGLPHAVTPWHEAIQVTSCPDTCNATVHQVRVAD